jgi:hypothetical protein
MSLLLLLLNLMLLTFVHPVGARRHDGAPDVYPPSLTLWQMSDGESIGVLWMYCGRENKKKMS